MTVGGFFKGLKRRIGAILHSFRFTMIGSVFLIMLGSGIIAGGIASAVYHSHPDGFTRYTPVVLVLIALPSSVLLGTVFSIIVSKQILRPVDDLIRATERIARGDFSTPVPVLFRKKAVFVILSDLSFIRPGPDIHCLSSRMHESAC